MVLEHRSLIPASALDGSRPNFVPGKASPAAAHSAVIPQQEFFDQAANYMGAFRPGVQTTWLDDWTDFSLN